jgi:hypothetical protein
LSHPYKRKIRITAVHKAVETIEAMAEHIGDPWPFHRVFRRSGKPFSAIVTWQVGARQFQVKVCPGGVECLHVDPECSVRGYPVDCDLAAAVRDGIDWLRGLPLHRGPIPPFDPEREEA